MSRTFIQFSKNLIKEMPSMIINSVKSSGNSVSSWINTSVRIISSIGDVVSNCEERKRTAVITQKIDEAKNEIDNAKFNEKVLLFQKHKELINEINASIMEEKKKVDEFIHKAEIDAEKVLKSLCSVEDYQNKINEETELQIQSIKEENENKLKNADLQNQNIYLKLNQEFFEQEALSQSIAVVREGLRKVIEMFEEHYINKEYLRTLSRSEKDSITEQYRLLQRQYHKQFDI